MFSSSVVETDRFLELSSSAQALYFHLGMHADDDGFVAAPRKIAIMAGCTTADLDTLTEQSLVIFFESGVCVIADWKQNNFIRSDRYHETRYEREKALLSDNANGSYSLRYTNGIPDDNQGSPRAVLFARNEWRRAYGADFCRTRGR
jgi:hypothetical protein